MLESTGVRIACTRWEADGIRGKRPRLSVLLAAAIFLFLFCANIHGEETRSPVGFAGNSGVGTNTGPEKQAVKKFTLTVKIQPKKNQGWVTALGAKIGCSSVCAVQFPEGAKITLVPKPADGYAFDSWSIETSAVPAKADNSKDVSHPLDFFDASGEALESHDLSNALFIEIFSNLRVSAIFKPVSRDLTKISSQDFPLTG